MGNFKITQTPVKDMFVIEPKIFADSRGYFIETYRYEDFKESGLDMIFVQDNQSKSTKGVLRGLHFQTQNPQGKLVRVIKGTVYDVGVDLRRNSETFGKWYGEVLSAENKKQLYVPEGFAHGFLVLSDEAEFVYKCTRTYDPSGEGGIQWDDPTLAIEWPIDAGMEILLSDKDKCHPSFDEWVKNR